MNKLLVFKHAALVSGRPASNSICAKHQIVMSPERIRVLCAASSVGRHAATVTRTLLALRHFLYVISTPLKQGFVGGQCVFCMYVCMYVGTTCTKEAALTLRMAQCHDRVSGDTKEGSRHQRPRAGVQPGQISQIFFR